MNKKPISRKANIVVQTLKNEVLVYDLRINKAYCLNQTAGLVFQLCDGTRTLAAITELMSRKLKIKVSENFVWFALEELKKENLLVNSEELNSPFAGVSRREVVRRVGLTCAAAVALPLITSLVAPQSIHAASLKANNQTCSTLSTASTECASGKCVTSTNSSGIGSTSRCCSNSTGGFQGTTGFTFPGLNQADCTSRASGGFCCSASAAYNGAGNCICS